MRLLGDVGDGGDDEVVRLDLVAIRARSVDLPVECVPVTAMVSGRSSGRGSWLAGNRGGGPSRTS